MEIEIKNWPKENPARVRTSGQVFTCDVCWVTPSPDGTAFNLVPQTPLNVKTPDGPKRGKTYYPKDTVSLRLDGDGLHVTEIDNWMPFLTKAQGMDLAYYVRVPGSAKDVAIVNFEKLLYLILLSTPPGQLVSSDTVWLTWIRLGWPKYEGNKSWVPGCMKKAATGEKPSSRFVTKARSVVPWNKNKKELPICQYASLIYDPQFSSSLVPRQMLQEVHAEISEILAQNRT